MTVSPDSAQRISLLFEAARVHGSLVSLNDLVHLMPEHVSEKDIAEAIRSHPELNSKFALESGYVVERKGNLDLDGLISVERQSRVRASANLLYAMSFVPLLKSSRFDMVGVSGSTSYRSASRSRDLDLFCIARSGTMWISLVRALLLARGFGLSRKSSPPICLSCVMDESFAGRTFTKEQGPLFARDALEIVVLIGEPAYVSILSQAGWISKIYPAGFARRTTPTRMPPATRVASAWARAFNRFTYILVGSYIGLKSFLLNRRLTASGKMDNTFAIHKGEDHLVYESRRYAKLRRHYSEASPESKSTYLRVSGREVP